MIYKIISEKSPEEMQKSVNKEIERRWFPQGGVAVVTRLDIAHDEAYELYFQAMTKDTQ